MPHAALVGGAHRPPEGDRRLDRRRAESEYLYDKPYVDNARVRVAGPFTVESLSPHRVARRRTERRADRRGFDGPAAGKRYDGRAPERDFAGMVLDYLKAAGVQQADKGDRITFKSLVALAGQLIGAEGALHRGRARERRAGILIGPEFGTVGRADLVAAAREAVDARFDVLIACAFNFDAHSSEFEQPRPPAGPQGAHEPRPAHGAAS